MGSEGRGMGARLFMNSAPVLEGGEGRDVLAVRLPIPEELAPPSRKGGENS